jgi:hypothetical protein
MSRILPSQRFSFNTQRRSSRKGKDDGEVGGLEGDGIFLLLLLILFV